MNKIVSIPCLQDVIYTAYTNQKVMPDKIKTDTAKQKQRRDTEPLEDLMDYMNLNPFTVLFSGIFRKK